MKRPACPLDPVPGVFIFCAETKIPTDFPLLPGFCRLGFFLLSILKADSNLEVIELTAPTLYSTASLAMEICATAPTIPRTPMMLSS